MINHRKSPKTGFLNNLMRFLGFTAYHRLWFYIATATCWANPPARPCSNQPMGIEEAGSSTGKLVGSAKVGTKSKAIAGVLVLESSNCCATSEGIGKGSSTRCYRVFTTGAYDQTQLKKQGKNYPEFRRSRKGRRYLNKL